MLNGHGHTTLGCTLASRLQLHKSFTKDNPLYGDFAEQSQRIVACQISCLAVKATALAPQGEWPRPKDASWEEVRLWLRRASAGAVLLVLENAEDVLQQEQPTKVMPLSLL